jgi:hypothetical protein
MLILVLFFLLSVSCLEVQFPPNIGDVGTPYYWKFQIWSNGVAAGGSVSVGHHVIMAVPYYDAAGAQLVPYSTQDGKLIGSRYRIELFFTPDTLPIPVTGKLATFMKSTKYQFPGDSPADFGDYTLWDKGFMTTVKTTPINVGSQYSTLDKRYGTGKRYFLVGNNCQNFAGDFLTSLKGAFT